MAKKSDFMQDKLRAFVLELADLKGYEKPSTYLNEKLDEVKEFNDFSFECDFYLNIHYLCKENADKFWSDSHKKDISNWLRKSSILTDAFDTTWQALPPQPIVESPFSVLEWATIFYYADETKLLPENRTIKARIEQFIKKYEIDTTPKYFRTQYYDAKKRINEKNDYPINKLELIIPFLKENYKQTVTKVENDIIFLEKNMPEY